MEKPEIWDKLTEDAKKDIEAIARLERRDIDSVILEWIYVALRSYEFHGDMEEYKDELVKLGSETV